MPKIAANFEVGSAQPIDTRFVVQNESDLDNLKKYEGLEVYILSLQIKKIYTSTGWKTVSTPTKVSELENDSGYVTEESVSLTEEEFNSIVDEVFGNG